MKRINITHATAAFAVAAALAASAALAGDKTKRAAPVKAPAAAAAQMFEHVRVERASPELLAQIAAEQHQKVANGMRAYLDSNGNLRAPTADDVAAEAAVVPLGKSAAPSAAATSAAAETSAPESYHADGSVSVVLDESSMSYSVATKSADGKVKEQCVTGQPNQQAALAAASKGGDRNEK
jgi:hypothetical protein